MIFGASFVYGGGLLVAGLAQEWHNWYYGLILPVAVAGGTVMTLSWALLFKLMPAEHRGAIAGLATTTKGLGLLIGPLVAGVMIDVMKPYLKRPTATRCSGPCARCRCWPRSRSSPR